MFRNVKKEILTVPAQMSYLTGVRDFIEKIGKKYRFSDKMVNSFKLVVDEACTNIIRHGYRDVKGGEIVLKAIIRRQSLTIAILDQGTSYDPRQANTPDLDKYIQIGKKGGLGILMMRKLMDDVQYNITSRGNELRLTKQRDQYDYGKIKLFWNNLSMRARYSVIASTILTIIAIFVFLFMYLPVNENTLNGVIEQMQSQTKVLAENSKEDMNRNRVVKLYMLSHAHKENYSELVNEVFILDTANNIQAISSPLKASEWDIYQIPEDAEEIEDTTANFRITKYVNTDGIEIYDFSSPVFSALYNQSPVIGYVHIWVADDYIHTKARDSKIKIIIWIVFLLIIGYVGSYFLIDRIVRPLLSLADWVRQVGHGTVDEDEIDIDASDELGEVAQAFNQMTNKFREAQVNLIEQQRLRKELQVAQEIQHMLLPSDFPKVEGYDIASYYEAAKEVGGDLFDFVEVDDDTIGICVADVSGKGVPGSMIMTMIRTALRLEARGNKNPANVLSKVNRFVTDDMKRGMFVTMFYIVLDSRNRIIHYASAGHNPMILYRGSTKQTYFLNPSGFPVGIQLPDISLFDKRIEEDSIRLREDDLLVLYTDGITEAMNSDRELYREERFLDAIRKNHHFDVGEFVKNIKNDIKHHTEQYPQNDDITFVAVKEKLMAGEVIYNIQKELFRLIEEDKVPVKEACERMRVSQYMYRKYKRIKKTRGIEALKELLNESDYIEKKHLSLEVKTKLYEVIRKYPKYGTKKISDTLNTEEFGFTKLEQHRIYEELRRAKLNTKEKREAFIRKSGTKRVKLPGTPLLTMDGEVILDFESSEQAVAKKRGGETTPKQFQAHIPDDKKADPKVMISRSANTGQLATPKPAAPEPEKPKQPAPPKKAEPPKQADKPETGKTQQFSADSTGINTKDVADFLSKSQDDLKIIDAISSKWSDKKKMQESDLKKIITSLKIISKNPRIKKIGKGINLYEQVIKNLEQYHQAFEQLNQPDDFQIINEWLNYIKKENILNNSDIILEKINELGIQLHKMKTDRAKKTESNTQNLDYIREKLANKKVLKSKIIEKALQNSNGN